MTADVCSGDHHVVSVYQSGHCDCGAWTWDVDAAPQVGGSSTNPREQRHALFARLKQVLGSVPVGTSDLLNVLLHPDVIDYTRVALADSECAAELEPLRAEVAAREQQWRGRYRAVLEVAQGWERREDSVYQRFIEQRDRANRQTARVAVLEQQLAAVRERLEELAARCPEDDWPANGGMEDAAIADSARYVLRALSSVVVRGEVEPAGPSEHTPQEK